MGVAGASINPHGILMTGIAGLLAGACSMALGEWISVTSSRELAEREIRIESRELAEDPIPCRVPVPSALWREQIGARSTPA
jgi:VIT1/CCC1 family predicted Fe2+/Mn2+ transporter